MSPVPYNRKYNLSKLTDDEISDFLDSGNDAASDVSEDQTEADGDFDDDDEIADPNYQIDEYVGQLVRASSTEFLDNALILA